MRFDIVQPEIAGLAGDVGEKWQSRHRGQVRYGDPAIDGLNRSGGRFGEIRANEKDLHDSASKGD
jgi:hypothetical protein